MSPKPRKIPKNQQVFADLQQFNVELQSGG